MTETWLVRWSNEAVSNLQAIVSYIEAFDPDAAGRIAVRLTEAADSLTYFPNRGRPSIDGTRELPSVAPYILRYRVEDDTVIIVHVRHGARQPI